MGRPIVAVIVPCLTERTTGMGPGQLQLNTQLTSRQHQSLLKVLIIIVITIIILLLLLHYYYYEYYEYYYYYYIIIILVYFNF